MKSLLEHIVTKHLTTVSDHPPAIKDKIHPNDSSSLEELANPYGDTLTQLRKKYEENKYSAGGVRGDSKAGAHLNDDTAEVNNAKARSSNKKALEDQVRSFFWSPSFCFHLSTLLKFYRPPFLLHL